MCLAGIEHHFDGMDAWFGTMERRFGVLETACGLDERQARSNALTAIFRPILPDDWKRRVSGPLCMSVVLLFRSKDRLSCN